jgi:hypothetical protein
MDNIDELLVNLRIVNAGQLAAHQLRRIDRDVVRKNAPCFLRPNLDRLQRQLAFIEVQIKRVVQTRVASLDFVSQHVGKLICR